MFHIENITFWRKEEGGTINVQQCRVKCLKGEKSIGTCCHLLQLIGMQTFGGASGMLMDRRWSSHNAPIGIMNV